MDLVIQHQFLIKKWSLLIETIKNEAKEQKGGFLIMLLGTLGASWLGNLIAGFLILSHPLTNSEIQKYYQNEPKFNGLYSRNNLLKIMGHM